MDKVGAGQVGGAVSQRRAKHQAPMPKLQRSSKSQVPNSKKINSGQTTRRSVFELGAWCFFGAWSLELGAFCLALSFSKFETHPGRSGTLTGGRLWTKSAPGRWSGL